MGAKVRPENFKGNKNSGRKPFSVELAEALATGVANMIHNEELEKLYNKDNRSLEEMKTLVTPLTVKGIVEKKDINVITPKPLLYELFSNNNSNQKDSKAEEENPYLSGRNKCLENNLNPDILDTLSSE